LLIIIDADHDLHILRSIEHAQSLDFNQSSQYQCIIKVTSINDYSCFD